MASIQVNGVRLNVQQINRPSDRPKQDLLMVHGLASNLGFWIRGYVDALAEDFRITLLDMRGHGRSEFALTGYTPDHLGDDLAAASEALGLVKPHVVAHSFGGVAAMNWATRYPGSVSSMVILDTLISLGRDASIWRRPDPALQTAMAEHGIGLDLSDAYGGMHLLTAIARRKLDTEAVPPKDPRVAFMLDTLQTSAAQKWLQLVERTDGLEQLCADDGITQERLAAFDAPLLAMYGACSPTLPAGQILAEATPRGWLEVLPGAGHFFASTQAHTVLTNCIAFWSAVGEHDLPVPALEHQDQQVAAQNSRVA